MLYVAGEIFLWMALAFVLGVLVGWFVWGVRRRSTGAKPAAKVAGAGAVAAAAAATPTGDIESVTVRPAVMPVSDAPPALPVTPPAGTPIVVARATPPADDTTAEVEVVPPLAAPAPPAGDDADASTSPALAALVADDAADALNDRVAELEDEVTFAPDAEAAEDAGERLAAAEEAATAQDVAEARAAADAAALGPDLAAGAATLGRKVSVDDLKVVEGIGPRIEEVLKESGINTWDELAGTSPDRLRTILDLAGDQFRVHDPATWPRQAGLAAEGRWDELVELQTALTGGRHA